MLVRESLSNTFSLCTVQVRDGVDGISRDSTEFPSEINLKAAGTPAMLVSLRPDGNFLTQVEK